jgi:hypothetical protein
MNIEIGRRMDTLTRVITFSEAYPEDSEGYRVMLSRLKEGAARVEALATQQRAGLLDTRAATAQKKKLRSLIQHHLLVPMARVAIAAAAEAPELGLLFRPPASNAGRVTWRTAAHAIATEAAARKDLLLRHGMSEAMLKDLVDALDQYDAALGRGNVGRSAHVGATADLEAVQRSNMQVIDLLDGLNRYRFRDNPELLAAWASARNVVGPFNHEPPAPEVPVAPAA